MTVNFSVPTTKLQANVYNALLMTSKANLSISLSTDRKTFDFVITVDETEKKD